MYRQTEPPPATSPCSLQQESTPPYPTKKANLINHRIRYDTSNRIIECVCACGSNSRYSTTKSIS